VFKSVGMSWEDLVVAEAVLAAVDDGVLPAAGHSDEPPPRVG
jgi:hypothetical protein